MQKYKMGDVVYAKLNNNIILKEKDFVVIRSITDTDATVYDMTHFNKYIIPITNIIEYTGNSKSILANVENVYNLMNDVSKMCSAFIYNNN